MDKTIHDQITDDHAEFRRQLRLIQLKINELVAKINELKQQ